VCEREWETPESLWVMLGDAVVGRLRDVTPRELDAFWRSEAVSRHRFSFPIVIYQRGTGLLKP
jgi:hypothetical protein